MNQYNSGNLLEKKFLVEIVLFPHYDTGLKIYDWVRAQMISIPA